MSKKPENRMNNSESKASLFNTTNSVGAIDSSTLSDFVSNYDEAAKRRLDSMNQKLKDMEREMEALEAQITMVNLSCHSDRS